MKMNDTKAIAPTPPRRSCCPPCSAPMLLLLLLAKAGAVGEQGLVCGGMELKRFAVKVDGVQLWIVIVECIGVQCSEAHWTPRCAAP